MIKTINTLALSVLFAGQIFANGIAVFNAQNHQFLRLLSSDVSVQVENQVAITTVTNVFQNDYSVAIEVKYAFPTPETASPTGLRWYVDGAWYEAEISAQPGDTTLPGQGGETPEDILNYLGPTPLYFNINEAVASDSTIIIELTYVQLLPYDFGTVSYFYPNNYTAIQAAPINSQHLDFNLISERTIDNIEMLSDQPVENISNNGNSANVECQIWESPADSDYQLEYALNPEELGLFSLSTFIPDSLLPEPPGGFFLFVAEPDPSTSTEVINKVFTLIIDRSGSMYGDKIIQARAAASFIVDSLNVGDRFNIIDFASTVMSFHPQHVPYTVSSRDSALQYIASLQASGGTNIGQAFSTAIPQFSTSDPNTANIIIFFTDGEATEGITATQSLVNHIDNLVTTAEINLTIFCFGIGSNANEQLLTLIATHHNGIAAFLGNEDLYTEITRFYLTIRNPVLLNTVLTFYPNVLSEIYPNPLPNLYKGQQLIASGRYSAADDISVNLSGLAFGQQMSYQYGVTLADTAVNRYQFLTKIWAKQKIEHLLVEFYSLPNGSAEANAIHDEIIWVSVNYGVISPFTSFTNPTEISDEFNIDDIQTVDEFELVGNYPNPFNASTTVKFNVVKPFAGQVFIKIYNALGQLVRVLSINVNGTGNYQIIWDGKMTSGLDAPSGTYVFILDFGKGVLGGRMCMIK